MFYCTSQLSSQGFGTYCKGSQEFGTLELTAKARKSLELWNLPQRHPVKSQVMGETAQPHSLTRAFPAQYTKYGCRLRLRLKLRPIAPDKAAYCVFTQFCGPENAIKIISVRTKTQ